MKIYNIVFFPFKCMYMQTYESCMDNIDLLIQKIKIIKIFIKKNPSAILPIIKFILFIPLSSILSDISYTILKLCVCALFMVLKIKLHNASLSKLSFLKGMKHNSLNKILFNVMQ